MTAPDGDRLPATNSGQETCGAHMCVAAMPHHTHTDPWDRSWCCGPWPYSIPRLPAPQQPPVSLSQQRRLDVQQPPAQEREDSNCRAGAHGLCLTPEDCRCGCHGTSAVLPGTVAPPSEADSAGEDAHEAAVAAIRTWIIRHPRPLHGREDDWWPEWAARNMLADPEVRARITLAASPGVQGGDVRPWVLADGDSRCQDCGRPNPLWTADNALWNRVLTGDPAVPRDGVILCPTCFATKADPLTPLGVRIIEAPHPGAQGGDGEARLIEAVTFIGRWVDASLADRVQEVRDRVRITKVCEESGEVWSALDRVYGANPRKTGSWDEVDKELLDTAGAALGAIEYRRGYDGQSLRLLADHMAGVAARAAAHAAQPVRDTGEGR